VRAWIKAVVIIAVLGAGVALCVHDDPVAEELTPSADERPSLRFSSDWWRTEDAQCPGGTVYGGAAPPDGREVWCALPDGTRHGPNTMWWPNGRTSIVRSYDRGTLHGSMRKWRPDGRRWETGGYEHGVRVGRWVHWGDDGAARVTDHDGATGSPP
jgi:hypothetical protein